MAALEQNVNLVGASQRRLEQLLERDDLWRGNAQHSVAGVDTGFASLNQHLLNGGWPLSGLCELFQSSDGVGELSVLLPLIAKMIPSNPLQTTTIEGGAWVSFVAPKYIIYPESLSMQGIDVNRLLWVDTADRKEQLWALEQILTSGASPLVLCWLDKLSVTEARRLQLASEKGTSLCVCYLPQSAVQQAHPVQLRLQLDRVVATSQGADLSTNVSIIKRRGGWPVADFKLPLLPPYMAQSFAFDGITMPAAASMANDNNVLQGPWST
ncbi:translesion DNA synthesis-associated protein ImuA [Shewanella colwelliana]|uniref:translesion DNA synthesis-associated protein ImuA n=1 Tax=Shewanella colwelliana TaxID=23 RepID=UPI0022AF539B|nr:translesion DNA synthesis-associated protein ImuA [Shewanella colwelliana]MCZ4338680.1 translesion DNA synthesis-associated protein ImuA [Shewanella colwelliana]